MNDYADLWDRFEKTGAAEAESYAAWAANGRMTDKLAMYYLDRENDSWFPLLFRTFKAMKARGVGFVGKPLPFPEARSVADLFESARFLPTDIGNGMYRDQAQKALDAQAGGEGFCFVSSHRSGGFAVSLHIGGKRDWSPEWLARGEKQRRHMGARFFSTYARPSTDVRIRWGETIGTDGEWKLGSFEAVQRDSGHILLIGRSVNGFSNLWLALLDPGASLVELMPQEDRDLVEENKAAELEAWGE